MDEHEKQQQRLRRAAEQFTDALMQSFRTAAEHGVDAQRQVAQLNRDFFNTVVENLRAQAQRNQEMTQQLVDQQQRGAEAAQQLTQETVEAYTSLVNSMLSSSFQQGGTQVAQIEDEPPRVEGSIADEAEEAPSEDIGSIVRESVSRSEVGSRQEEEPQARTSASEQSRADDEQLAIEDYDSLSVKQISERLRLQELSDEEVEQLRRYEAANKNRSTLLRRLDERL